MNRLTIHHARLLSGSASGHLLANPRDVLEVRLPILVQKFGGSSVADLDRLRKVARRIVETRRAGYDLVVVVSAMGDTTDELLAMAHIRLSAHRVGT